MQWLLILRPVRAEMLTNGPTPEEVRMITEHFSYWQRLVQEGVAFLVGRTQTTDPGTIGLAIFRAEDEEAAALIAQHDPAVAGGVFSFEVRPYAIALLGEPDSFRPS